MSKPDFLTQTRQLIETGQIEQVRPILIKFIKKNPQQAEAWYQLSLCVETEKQQRHCLQQARQANPSHQATLAALQQLNKPPNPSPPLPQIDKVTIPKPAPNKAPTQPVDIELLATNTATKRDESLSERDIQLVILAIIGIGALIFLIPTPLFIRLLIFSVITFASGLLGRYLRKQL